MGKRVSLPFEKSNLAPQYEYTNAMYEEDHRIARWCVYKRFATVFTEKSITKEDLVQWCVARLWQKRPAYDPTRGKYSTWAIMVCRRVIFYAPIIKRQKDDAQRDELDHILSTDEHGHTFALLETLGKDDKEPVDDLLRIIYQAVDNIHAPVSRAKAKQVIDLMLTGKIKYSSHAAPIIGCTRERVRQLLNKVRTHALQILANGNTFSRQEYERQLVITQQTPRPYICKKRYYSRKPQTQKPRERKPRPVIDIDLSQATFKQLYRAKGFTQNTLAQQIGVDQTSVCYWSRGGCRPKPEYIEKLASVFNCTVEQMQAIILRKEQTK